MFKIMIIILYVLAIQQVHAQKITSHYVSQADSLKIGTGERDFLPYNRKGYTLILPANNAPVKGVLISLDDAEFKIDKIPAAGLLYPQANDKGFAVLYVSTGIPVDLFLTTLRSYLLILY